MRTTLLLATATTLLSAPAVFAQTSGPITAPPPASTAQQSTVPEQQPIRTQIQKDLQAAGFTNIQIMPSSFLVRAKNKGGNPVLMVINPDSIAEFVDDQGNAATAGQTSSQ